MITAEELIGMTEQEQQKPFKLGTVVELFAIGTAKIQFDGEEEPSEKEYPYLASYTPSIGDRVLLASVSGTYIITDKIIYRTIEEEQPNNFARIAKGTYVGNGSTSPRTINVGFTPKVVICYGDGERTTAGRGIAIADASFGIGKYWNIDSHNVGIVSGDGGNVPDVVNNGFKVKHINGVGTLNVSGVTYRWVAIG